MNIPYREHEPELEGGPLDAHAEQAADHASGMSSSSKTELSEAVSNLAAFIQTHDRSQMSRGDMSLAIDALLYSLAKLQKHVITPQDEPELSEPGLIQVLIFHPNHGKQPKAPPFPQTPWDEETANRQRAINLELERAQVDDNATVRDIVLGTNNFVYAVMEYPASELNMKENQP